MYPRFDDGSLRIVLALTSAPFAAAVTAASVNAKTPARASGLAILFSAILGIASTILPSAILTHDKSGEFFVACFFGSFFGAPTGALYGIPLEILAGCGHAHVRAGTHDATDGAARIGGAWLAVMSLVAVCGTKLLDSPKMDWATAQAIPASPLPWIVACGVGVLGLAVAGRGVARTMRRAAWLDRVRSGLVPEFRVRPIDARDPVESLPCFSQAAPRLAFEDVAPATILEWVPNEAALPMSGTAYRVIAVGKPVAIVSAESPIAF